MIFPAGPDRDESSDEDGTLPEITCEGGVRLPQIGAGVGE